MSTGKRNNLTRLVQKYSGNHPIVYKIHDAVDKRIKQFAGGHKLRSDAADLSCRPFFIIGSGRSGNTLLRTILFQNPDIVIPPESYVLGKAIRRYRQLSWLEWEELCSVVISV
ncbi:MAG TPA: sulfotransferase, partial [Bacillales bacterium]